MSNEWCSVHNMETGFCGCAIDAPSVPEPQSVAMPQFDDETRALMRKLEASLLRNSKPLEPEFAKIVNDNWMQMIRDSNN